MPCFKNLDSYSSNQELKAFYTDYLIKTDLESELPNMSNDNPVSMLRWLITLCNGGHKSIIKNYKAKTFEELLLDPNILNDPKSYRILNKLTEIALSEDNFFKIALIYLRMRSQIPVILMGETGIGKTALLELLSYIM
jgi:hypothetical protein